MKKTFTFQNRLKGYSILASSLVASAANSQVIYTDVDPDVVLGGAAPSSYPDYNYDSLDLNNDGTFDFKVTLNFYGTDPQASGFSFVEKIDGDFAQAYNRVFTYTIDYVPWGFELSCNDSIPLGSNFFGSHYGYFAFQAGNVSEMHWDSVQDGYVGLKFKVGADVHYGWVRLDVNTMDTTPNIVIKDFAYEATPLHKIAACVGSLGIFEVGNNEAASLMVYPNPSSGICKIKLPASVNGDAELSLINEFGQQVYQSSVVLHGQNNELPLDFSFVTSGVYMVQVKTNAGLFSGRFIKH